MHNKKTKLWETSNISVLSSPYFGGLTSKVKCTVLPMERRRDAQLPDKAVGLPRFVTLIISFRNSISSNNLISKSNRVSNTHYAVALRTFFTGPMR